ncbi:putative Neural/ectodermal development factor IMP-L2 [Hypsibius exemplaris]|uniref:Neural/ectodermal development factor IMP-L2 n=1 Tax=Hypsibius exemplaris TaxID=2072580 RepID=A0A1W0XEV6_HYPEX|nr:putative Neural/ectodermal development factor IMP-L2 [Hypsibius exemplaris]
MYDELSTTTSFCLEAALFMRSRLSNKPDIIVILTAQANVRQILNYKVTQDPAVQLKVMCYSTQGCCLVRESCESSSGTPRRHNHHHRISLTLRWFKSSFRLTRAGRCVAIAKRIFLNLDYAFYPISQPPNVISFLTHFRLRFLHSASDIAGRASKMIVISLHYAGILLTFCVFYSIPTTQGIPATFVGGRSRRSTLGTGGAPDHNLRFHEIKPASHMETYLHDSISLTCQASGSPPPTLHWLKNGKPISQDNFDNSLGDEEDPRQPDEAGTVQSIGMSVTRSRLFLDCLTPQDTAIYTCVAQTPYSRISTDTKLVVSDITNKLSGNECIMEKRGSYGKPARITMWTETRLELLGADVKLFCRVSGTPTPQVTWERAEDGQLIQNDAKHKILPNGDLIIKKLSWEEDMGRFVCVAQNNLGMDKAKMFLYPTSGF